MERDIDCDLSIFHSVATDGKLAGQLLVPSRLRLALSNATPARPARTPKRKAYRADSQGAPSTLLHACSKRALGGVVGFESSWQDHVDAPLLRSV